MSLFIWGCLIMFSNCLQIRLWEGVSGVHREGRRSQAGSPDFQPASHKVLLLLCICLTHTHTSLRNTMNSFELYKLHQISRLDQAVETRLYYSNTQPPNLRASPTKHVILTHMSDMLYRFMLIAVTQGTRRTQAPSGQTSTPNKVDKKEMLNYTLALKESLPIFLTNASHLAPPYLQEKS